jgi:hypothetical protein
VSDRFRVSGGLEASDHDSLDAALTEARLQATQMATTKADAAGAASPDIVLSESINSVMVEGLSIFVEATIKATATSRPRTARSM